MPAPTHQHDPWTHQTHTRTGPWHLATLHAGCTCGWTGPTYDLHDTTPGLAHDEATWAHQDHLDTTPTPTPTQQTQPPTPPAAAPNTSPRTGAPCNQTARL